MLVWIALCVSTAGVAAQYHKTITFKSAPGINKDSLFGFSVAYQASFKRLIVGAPKADHVGQVYTYELESENWTQSRTNLKKTQTQPTYYTYENRTGEYSDYWLGASVAASSTFYVACAPMFMEEYKFIYMNIDDNHKRHKLLNINQGKCFIQKDKNGVMQKMEGMLLKYKQYNTTVDTVSDTLGWSLDIASDGSVLVGGPNMQGTERGLVVVYNQPEHNAKENPKVIKIEYYKVDEIRYNLGYSVAAGHFFSKNESDMIYAIGSSYGKIGQGKIIFIEKHISFDEKRHLKEVFFEISGDGAGEMFSAALCSATLNYDGMTDLLVGAPTAADGDNEVGVVHVYFSDAKDKLKHQCTLSGTATGGYFGFAIANIGDMDSDKRDDIVIAAPYEDDGRGAIYLYYGKVFSGKDKPTHAQRIQPEKSSVRYFGYSLAPLPNFDSKGAYGLAVGSPGSAEVAMLNYLLIIALDLQITENAQQRGTDTKFTLKSCLKVTRPQKPEFIHATIKMKVSITHPHATIAPDGKPLHTYSVNLDNKTSICEDVIINTPKYGDYSKQIKYNVRVYQQDDPQTSSTYDSTHALLIEEVQKQGSIWAETDCVIPGNCKPTLSLNMSTSIIKDEYLVGSTNSENVSITLMNTGETAYKAYYEVEVMGVNILRQPAECTLTAQGKIVCSRHSIMYNSSSWNIDIVLETSALTSKDKEFSVSAKVNDDRNTNEIKSIFHLIYDTAGISVTEKSNHSTLIGMTDDEIYNAGKTFKQVYWIKNSGCTNWIDMKFQILLENQPYIRYTNIKIINQQQQDRDCPLDNINNSIEKTLAVDCHLGNLMKEKAIKVQIGMLLLRNTLEHILDEKNITISSTMKVMDSNMLVLQNKTITTSIMWIRRKTPWWIIAAGILCGLVILNVIVVILYKNGFFKRKKKENLVQLKRTASQRMSMRSSVNRRSNSIFNDPYSPDSRMSVDETALSRSSLLDNRRRSATRDTNSSSMTITNQRRRSIVMDAAELVSGSDNRDDCRNRTKNAQKDD